MKESEATSKACPFAGMRNGRIMMCRASACMAWVPEYTETKHEYSGKELIDNKAVMAVVPKEAIKVNYSYTAGSLVGWVTYNTLVAIDKGNCARLMECCNG